MEYRYVFDGNFYDIGDLIKVKGSPLWYEICTVHFNILEQLPDGGFWFKVTYSVIPKGESLAIIEEVEHEEVTEVRSPRGEIKYRKRRERNRKRKKLKKETGGNGSENGSNNASTVDDLLDRLNQYKQLNEITGGAFEQEYADILARLHRETGKE